MYTICAVVFVQYVGKFSDCGVLIQNQTPQLNFLIKYLKLLHRLIQKIVLNFTRTVVLYNNLSNNTIIYYNLSIRKRTNLHS